MPSVEDPATLPTTSVATAPEDDGLVAGRTVAEWVAIDPGPTWRMTRLLTTWVWDILFRLRSYGADNVPAEGAFLFVPNHSSWLDQFFQGRGQRRCIRFMTKSTVFAYPGLAWYLRHIGAFPVRRGQGDSAALDVARGLLAAGHPVVVYPEGTRFQKTVELGPPRRGAARIALESGVPVLPVATWGAKPAKTRGTRRLHWPKVTTVYGPMLHFDGIEATPENVDLVRDRIWAEVTRLYELARQLHDERPPARGYVVPPPPKT